MKRVLPLTTALVSGVSLVSTKDAISQPLAPAFRTPAAVVAYSWTGLYAGGTLGYAAVNDHVQYVDGGHGCTTACGSQTDRSGGLLGGFQIGYNLQFGSWVFGPEADISAIAGPGGSESADCDGFGNCRSMQHSRQSMIATVRGRFGYAFGQSLLYATGGWAAGKTTASASDSGYVVPASWSVSGVRGGWTAGGGFEYALSSFWRIRAEALYYRLGYQTSYFGDPGSYDPVYGTLLRPPALFPVRFHDDGMLVRVGLSLSLGGSGRARSPALLMRSGRAYIPDRPAVAAGQAHVVSQRHFSESADRSP